MTKTQAIANSIERTLEKVKLSEEEPEMFSDIYDVNTYNYNIMKLELQFVLDELREIGE